MSTKLPAGFEPWHEQNTFMDHIGPIWMHRERDVDKNGTSGNDRIRIAVKLERRHTNALGRAHGGFLMSVMDLTMGLNASARVHDLGVVVTVQLSNNFVGTAHEGEVVIGEATVERVTRTLTFVSGRISADDRPLLVSTAIFRNPPPKADAKPEKS